jgi:monoamine oxidase
MRRRWGKLPLSRRIVFAMPPLSRRSFLAGAAAIASAPTWAATRDSDDVDIIVIGAGAAGIAAARRVLAAKRRVVVIEASGRIGGRCVTDRRLFGVPLDLGAHWIHAVDINPLIKLAKGTGLDVYPAPPGQKIRVGRRYARESEVEDFLSVLVRANRAINEAARGKTDLSCAQALPKDLGEWRDTVEFVLGPFSCAKDLSEVSAVDFSKSLRRDKDAFCRQGFGTLLATLAQGVPVRLSTPVKRIETWRRGRVTVETARGTIVGRAAIVTASTNVLAANKIDFDPNLPKRYVDAINQLRLGSYDHVILEVDGHPFGAQADDLIYEKSDDARTAAMLANVSGTQLCMVEVAGKFGRELSGQGEKAMVAFALDWVGSLYGAKIKRSVSKVYATRWNEQPFVLGAFSAASPGGEYARAALMDPIRDRVWFAGEAVHETLWGTVGGAWQSGERAAESAMRRLGFITTPREPVAERPSRSRSSGSRSSESRSRRRRRETYPQYRIIAPERY